MADDRNDLHGRAGDAASGSCYAVLNHLDRRSTPGADEAWVSGITYIPTRTGWSYLAVLIDLYSRKVVGWALAAADAGRAGLCGVVHCTGASPVGNWTVCALVSALVSGPVMLGGTC